MGKRKKPQHKLGEMNRAEWKQIRETIANQPPAPPAPEPTNPPAITETESVVVQAEIPIPAETQPEAPDSSTVEVKTKVSVTPAKPKTSRKKPTKARAKKRPATPKATKKKAKKAKPVETQSAVPTTKEKVKAEEKVEANLSPAGSPNTSGEVPPPPTRDTNLSKKKQRKLEGAWKKIHRPLPHHTLESVGLRRAKPKKEKNVKKKETVTSSSAGTGGGNDWIIPVILGVLALLLVTFIIARNGGLEVGGYIRQPIAALTQCCDDDEVTEVNVEAHCPAGVAEVKPDSAKAEEEQPLTTCDADTVIVRDTMYVRDGKDL